MTALVDAHLHLWDPRRFRYPWLAGSAALRRPFLPAALDTAGHRLAGAVFVEAGRDPAQAYDEVRWVEDLAARWPVLCGAVAHADLERGGDVAAALRRLAALPLVRGVRRNLQDEPPGFALADGHVDGVRLLAGHGLVAELCVRAAQLSEVTELVARLPQVTFVLDHLGKPPVRAGTPAPWREQLRRLAGHPNVVCKLSGLTTEADHARWRPGDVLPYLRHALAEFGPERCLFGSDWPVATLATGYDRWLAVVLEALHGRTSAQRAQVLGGTATRVYRLPAG
ncbi:amidohydrolase family protein [Amorphoplanes nipponensis]|uniref:Amidohydrolase n=1 Tax=Actinoplanes nipponensis TaxID=135950 RepID=A0A919JGW5_9ACTN|nr:amidohydrolase family protein [Actinoplanes nipponensis]GIE49080.1 amidohydrolase [Actinoplanes nipponensis]